MTGLVLNYFSQLKKVHDLLIVSPLDEASFMENTQKELFTKSIRIQFIDVNDMVGVERALETKPTTSITGVYLNCSSDECNSFLKQVVLKFICFCFY